MKKITTVVVTTALAASMVAGCGSDKNNATGESAVTTDAVVNETTTAPVETTGTPEETTAVPEETTVAETQEQTVSQETVPEETIPEETTATTQTTTQATTTAPVYYPDDDPNALPWG